MKNSNELSNWPWTPLYRDIPSEFYSLELDGPFEKCTLCESNVLNDPNCEYWIERIFRGSEPIIEYAICRQCHGSMSEELSVESMQKIEALFLENVDYESRFDRLREHLDDDDIDAWIGQCLVKNTPRVACRGGHQIIGHFVGDQILLDFAPIMLCEEFMEQVQEVISKKTRERLEDFVGTHFGMPPEFCDEPHFTPVLI